MRALLLALALALPGAAPARGQVQVSSAPRPITLTEAYRLSLRRSETLAQDREAAAEALARVDELKANILPDLRFVGQHTFQESPHTGISSINNTSIPNYYFQVTQPLFSGFREFLAFKAGRKTAESLRLTERRAESLLYQDVAQAFFNLVQARDELEIRGEALKTTADRIAQLERWVRIGRSRESEVLAARSQLAAAQAQLELARGSERVDQELLRFLTGVDSDFAPRTEPAPTLQPVEPFLEAARRRDDVAAEERSLEAAKLEVSVASRQRWGSLGVTGDYYVKRLGFSANTHYDAVFGLTVPIWDGGVISAQTSQARARARSAEQGLSRARRSAERDVRSSYVSLQWALSAVAALSKAADLAQQNLTAQERDYRLSLITNLEVLDTINSLQTTRLQLDAARQQAALARARLDVAAGGPSLPPAPEKP